MKETIISLVVLLFFQYGIGQTINPAYDSVLASKLQADHYGMKKYVLVILKTGPNKTSTKSFVDSCFAGHLNNMGKLVELKKLIVAGPFRKNQNDFRGLFILNVPTLEEAQQLLETDPAISAGLLLPESYIWNGSAALPEYLDEADKIWKSKP
ncbi:MAG: hypothetical protein JNL65_04090 [Saprospiraceae bacterium]|nr:hypothetical protein [Saprospiraceae bacterium]HRG68796.1 YciI family protein [Saprospiraceae bacterium]